MEYEPPTHAPYLYMSDPLKPDLVYLSHLMHMPNSMS